MPITDVVVESDVTRSFRVEQIAGMFDVAFGEKMRHEWHVDLPIEAREWRIGAVVGPSGSGKTRIARALWPDAYHHGFDWPAARAIVDAFPQDMSITDITGWLSSVGFSSPPSWAKSFDVLSNGERFRADIARVLAQRAPFVVVDEFTSVVDRTVAQIGSAAIAKTLRRDSGGARMIVLSCHYDILEWLAPDWTYDLRDGTFDWARLQRPAIDIEIRRGPAGLWRLFAPHHYLNTNELPSARGYYATWNGVLVGCVMVMPAIGMRGIWREARCVVLPDYQGVGIGGRISDAVADLYHAHGLRYVCTAAHPARVSYFNNRPAWRIVSVKRTGSSRHGGRDKRAATSTGRGVVSVEWVGDGRCQTQHAALREQSL